MANESDVVSTSQLGSLMSPSSVESYGLVKVMTDEQLDEYLSSGGSTSFELTKLLSSYITEFAVEGTYEDGVVTITGRCSLDDSPTGFDGSLVVAKIPEQYRPSSSVSGTCKVTTYYAPYAGTVTVDPDGNLTVTSTNIFWFEIYDISVTYRIDDGAQEPDGIYVVTVQQAVKYLGDMLGGGSGGGQ